MPPLLVAQEAGASEHVTLCSLRVSSFQHLIDHPEFQLYTGACDHMWILQEGWLSVWGFRGAVPGSEFGLDPGWAMVVNRPGGTPVQQVAGLLCRASAQNDRSPCCVCFWGYCCSLSVSLSLPNCGFVALPRPSASDFLW